MAISRIVSEIERDIGRKSRGHTHDSRLLHNNPSGKGCEYMYFRADFFSEPSPAGSLAYQVMKIESTKIRLFTQTLRTSLTDRQTDRQEAQLVLG